MERERTFDPRWILVVFAAALAIALVWAAVALAGGSGGSEPTQGGDGLGLVQIADGESASGESDQRRAAEGEDRDCPNDHGSESEAL